MWMEIMTKNKSEQKKRLLDWILRLLKGVLVGIGFITPGLSGGVLAVVFGIYESLMRFLGNIRENFVRNLLFFLPVGIGGVIGVVAFSAFVDFAFSNYAAQFTWLFIGFIAGTLPSLFKTSGKKGRKAWHWLMLVLIAAGTVFLMRWMENIRSVQLTPSFGNWVLSGAMIGLGVVVPGMSPSNFLIYLGLYQPMASGIRHLDLGVIVPLTLGGILIVLLLAKLISWLFKKFYTFMYHIILGIVVGSTIVIIPQGVRGWTIAVCAVLFVVGALISYFLAKLDEKYSREELFQ
jgi:putative membrane protein